LRAPDHRCPAPNRIPAPGRRPGPPAAPRTGAGLAPGHAWRSARPAPSPSTPSSGSPPDLHLGREPRARSRPRRAGEAEASTRSRRATLRASGRVVGPGLLGPHRPDELGGHAPQGHPAAGGIEVDPDARLPTRKLGQKRARHAGHGRRQQQDARQPVREDLAHVGLGAHGHGHEAGHDASPRRRSTGGGAGPGRPASAPSPRCSTAPRPASHSGPVGVGDRQDQQDQPADRHEQQQEQHPGRGHRARAPDVVGQREPAVAGPPGLGAHRGEPAAHRIVPRTPSPRSPTPSPQVTAHGDGQDGRLACRVMDTPAPDPQKLLAHWMEWERARPRPGGS
jgi:hypothetical protein